MREPDRESMSPPWRVLWTRSNCEQLVYDQLAMKGFDLFLPTLETWVRRGGVRRRERVPLFRSYLFLRAASIYGGTNEIQKNILTKAVLGL